MKRWLILVGLLFVVLVLVIYSKRLSQNLNIPETNIKHTNNAENPLQISAMRARDYKGSDLKIEQALVDGGNFHRYIASYNSDGLKIQGLLTVPIGEKPANGWPVIMFNHGYIPPDVYKTTERYVSYVDYFARNGYIVFKSDYRGNGSSEGQPEGAYYSPAYTVDVLNGLSSVKKFKDVDISRIGMWGHSTGGNITLRSLVVSKDLKAAVIWGGVVGTYDDLMNSWQRRVTYSPPANELALRNRSRSELIQKYGTPKTNPDFWYSIDPNYFLSDVSAPVQIHTGLLDEEVPYQFSEGLKERLEKVGKTVELYEYPGANHNISSPNFEIAMKRSLEFFDKYLKQQ
jgi:uncharacterized protein